MSDLHNIDVNEQAAISGGANYIRDGIINFINMVVAIIFGDAPPSPIVGDS